MPCVSCRRVLLRASPVDPSFTATSESAVFSVVCTDLFFFFQRSPQWGSIWFFPWISTARSPRWWSNQLWKEWDVTQEQQLRNGVYGKSTHQKKWFCYFTPSLEIVAFLRQPIRNQQRSWYFSEGPENLVRISICFFVCFLCATMCPEK